MIESNFFSKIPGAQFEFAGDLKAGPLYHWYWYDADKTDVIVKFLLSKKFTKGPSYTVKATIPGKFTRVELPVNPDPNEIVFHVEYFDGNGNCNIKQYAKSIVKKRIDILTLISIIGSIASVTSLVLQFLNC